MAQIGKLNLQTTHLLLGVSLPTVQGTASPSERVNIKDGGEKQIQGREGKRAHKLDLQISHLAFLTTPKP